MYSFDPLQQITICIYKCTNYEISLALALLSLSLSTLLIKSMIIIRLVVLDEPNVLRVLAEALTADHDVVFADNRVLVIAYAAVFEGIKRVPVRRGPFKSDLVIRRSFENQNTRTRRALIYIYNSIRDPSQEQTIEQVKQLIIRLLFIYFVR